MNQQKDYRVETVSVTDIDMGDRARKVYNNIEELGDSIAKHGLLNALTVLDKSKIPDANREQFSSIEVDSEAPLLLMAGGRRLSAYKAFPEKLGETVEAKIYERELSADELREIELVENIQREDLTWQERVDLEKEIHDLQTKIHGKKITSAKGSGHSMGDTAKMLNTSKSTISRNIKLAEAMEKLPQLRNAKSKSDAEKLLKKLKKTHTTDKRVKRIQTERSSISTDKQKKKLAQSYIVGPIHEEPLDSGFFHHVKDLPDQSMNFIEVDPPYAIDLSEKKRGGEFSTLSYNEVHAEIYRDFMLKTFKESYRVLRNNSWLICWFAPEPWFNDILELLRQAGFTVRGIPAIWTKGQGQTRQPARYLGNSYEMFFYAEKGKPSIFNAGRINDFRFSTVPSQRKIHPTERPVEMMVEVIETFTSGNGRVLVPFAGSGNTLLAASNLGMEGLAYDLSEDYRNEFLLRVEDGEIGEFSSYE